MSGTLVKGERARKTSTYTYLHTGERILTYFNGYFTSISGSRHEVSDCVRWYTLVPVRC